MQKGYISILATLVLLVVTGGIATTMLLVSTDSLRSGEALRNGERALLFSESCLEVGLLELVRHPDYSGANFAIPEGNCEVTAEQNGASFVVRATGKNTHFERKLVAEVALGVEKMEVLSWKEE